MLLLINAIILAYLPTCRLMTLPSVKYVILIAGPSNFNNPEVGPPCVFEGARSSASTQIGTADRNEAANAMSQNEIV